MTHHDTDPITTTRATAGQFGHPEDGGLIERIARAWAYMEGKGGRFDACKADPEQDRTEGYHSGYMAEAEELAERAGLFPTVAAIRALPAAQDGAEVARLRAELNEINRHLYNMTAVAKERHSERDALKAENERLRGEREKADQALVDRYRDPKSGLFSFPGDVAKIVRALDEATAASERKDAEIARLREALTQCRDYCRNAGRGNALVNDRIYERVEETCCDALHAEQGEER